MANVKAFSVRGIEMWIYTGDHRPPHFHARRPGEWEVRVYIEAGENEMIEIIRPGDARIKRNDRKALINGVKQFRHNLLNEWEDCQED